MGVGTRGQVGKMERNGHLGDLSGSEVYKYNQQLMDMVTKEN